MKLPIKTFLAISLSTAIAGPSLARSDFTPPTELPIAVARQTEPARKRLQENAAEVLKVLEQAGREVSSEDKAALEATRSMPDAQAIGEIQKVLDRYALALVNIDDEAWFSITPATRTPQGRPLQQGRWATYLIKVNNHSRATSPFEVRSIQAIGGADGDVSVAAPSAGECALEKRNWAQWFRLNLIKQPSMPARLSGKEIEYAAIQICSFDAGDRSAELTFYLGGGQVSQGHYGAIGLLFQPSAAQPSEKK